jgi:alanine-glyoxylate transaminase / serine-glyoxylate transaminase / serine-pyruvate transaminase
MLMRASTSSKTDPIRAMNPNLPTTAGIKLLHTPGPTHVPDLVRNAMSAQPFDLNDPRLTAVIENCERGLQRLLNTQHANVMMYTANGHGAWEAAIVNLLPPGGKVLVAGSGHFSETWAQAAEGCGAHAIRTEARAGSPIDPGLVEAALRADKAHEIVAVFAVQTDTSTGVTSDIHAVRQAIDRAQHPALFVVDVVASLAATRFEMDAWGVNVAIGASQKALMLPPGMSFTAVDEKALSAARNNPTPRVYWDWNLRKSPIGYRKFCGTPPESHLMGLEVSLQLIEREGHEAVFARHLRISRAVHAAVERWGEHGALWLMTKDPAARSTSITAIGVREGIDPTEIYTLARERFHVALAGGLGPHSGKVFRIGHLGDINEAMILGCLAGVEATLRLLNVPIGDGALERAVAVLNAHMPPVR